MYAKTVGLPGWFVASYTFLVFVADGVCRLHSPALSRIIEKTCRVHDVRYHAQDDVRAALGSPVRWLKRMGQPLAVEAM